MRTPVTGRVALVTGASSGIGAAAARLLIEQGMSVVLAARRQERLVALAQELGPRALPIAADVADETSVAALFDTVRDAFGGLDLLVNNAGIGVKGPFSGSNPDDWRRQIDINLYGTIRCTHAAIPLMRGREGAMICSVSSVAGRSGRPGWAVYSATKFAVTGFHDALRKELGQDGIRVTTLEPGSTWTDWGEGVSRDEFQQRRTDVDALHADDVARAMVYAFDQPARVLVDTIAIRPIKQLSP